MKVGDLVRVSADGDYHDPAWAGALGIVISLPHHGHGVGVRRIADGKVSYIVTHRAELPEEEQSDEGR